MQESPLNVCVGGSDLSAVCHRCTSLRHHSASLREAPGFATLNCSIHMYASERPLAAWVDKQLQMSRSSVANTQQAKSAQESHAQGCVCIIAHCSAKEEQSQIGIAKLSTPPTPLFPTPLLLQSSMRSSLNLLASACYASTEFLSLHG